MTTLPSDPARAAARRSLEYVYEDGDGYLFLDPESLGLIALPRERAGGRMRFVRAGARVQMVFAEGEPVALDLPATVELRVVARDEIEGSAMLETGLEVATPEEVRPGDVVRVDTRTGGCLGRVGA